MRNLSSNILFLIFSATELAHKVHPDHLSISNGTRIWDLSRTRCPDPLTRSIVKTFLKTVVSHFKPPSSEILERIIAF